jgi:predicted DNA binding protein
MAYYEAQLSVRHRCPFSTFSDRFPGVVIARWCDRVSDILEISFPEGSAEAARAGADSLARALGTRIVHRMSPEEDTLVLVMRCVCEKVPPPSSTEFEQFGCLEIQPATLAAGWEHYRMVAFREADLERLVRSLRSSNEQVQVTRSRRVSQRLWRDAFMVSTTALFGEMTARQRTALLRAYDHGYYRYPRGASVLDIAGELKVPRTTYLEHVRKAETKLMAGIEPYLRMYQSKDREPAAGPRRRAPASGRPSRR